MRNTATLIVAILVLGLGTGCAWSITKDGVKSAAGNAQVGANCDAEGVCKNVVKGGEISIPFADLMSGVLKAAMRLADAVPFVELGNPDELTVRIVEDERGD